MNEEQLRSQIDRARAYQAERLVTADREIAELERRLADARADRELWSKLSPHAITEHIAEELAAHRRREEASRDERAVQDRLDASHLRALAAAREGKALVAPGSRLPAFALLAGATIGAFIGGLGAKALGIHSEIWQYVMILLGGGAGFAAAGYGVAVTLVTDESLSLNPFGAYESQAVHDFVARVKNKAR